MKSFDVSKHLPLAMGKTRENGYWRIITFDYMYGRYQRTSRVLGR